MSKRESSSSDIEVEDDEEECRSSLIRPTPPIRPTSAPLATEDSGLVFFLSQSAHFDVWKTKHDDFLL